MTPARYAAGTPRFNHVAMSVPADLLDETNRRDLAAFYSEVLGFTEIEQMTQDRRRFILSACHYEQFVFVIAGDEPMRCPRMDHYGLSVSSLDDLMSVWERAKEYRERDARVDIVDPHVDDHEVVKIHSIYLGYLLPMMCELQYWEFTS